MTAAQIKRAEARKLAQARRVSCYAARAERAGRGEEATALRSQIGTLLADRCRECHRTLTDAASIAAGIGPECAAR